jgi:hypothetical protein
VTVGPVRRGRLGNLYHRYFRETRRERLFLASLSFFVTFGVTRLITHAIRRGELFGEVWIRGQHVHHLVWGILLLLAVGYAWLIQIGSGHVQSSRIASRVMAALYGAGAALTLDEFALWLNLRDVYWERQGRVSVDAVLLFGALVSAGLWGGPFLRGVARETMRFVRYSWHATQRRWRKGRLH